MKPVTIPPPPTWAVYVGQLHCNTRGSWTSTTPFVAYNLVFLEIVVVSSFSTQLLKRNHDQKLSQSSVSGRSMDTWHSVSEGTAAAPGVLQPGMHPVLLLHFHQVLGTGRVLWNQTLVPVKAAAMGKWFKLKSDPIQISPWEKGKGWNAAIWEQLLALLGSKQSTRRCPKEHALCWLIKPHDLQGCGRTLLQPSQV